MKRLGKWLLILSIICGVSTLGSIGLAGHIYYKGGETYTDYQEQDLDINCLKRLHINSVVPVLVKKTDGKPYVTFNESFTNALGSYPTYELKVEAKDQTTTISINELTDNILDFGLVSSNIYATVYLPEVAIEQLIIDGNKNNFAWFADTPQIQLEDMNIDELKINMAYAQVDLSGKYKKVTINSPGGNVNMKSMIPSEVNINHGEIINLSGQYQQVNIKTCEDIIISSDVAANIRIDDVYNQVKLTGAYEQVVVNGADCTVNVESNTPYEAKVTGDVSIINLYGPIKNVETEGSDTTVNVQSTIVPTKMRFNENSGIINLTLPSNIPGFKLSYNVRGNSGVDNESLGNIFSDFKLEQGNINPNNIIYNYGDGTTRINIQGDDMTMLSIQDGGYTSEK